MISHPSLKTEYYCPTGHRLRICDAKEMHVEKNRIEIIIEQCPLCLRAALREAREDYKYELREARLQGMFDREKVLAKAGRLKK